jgi:hypothetical protein
MIFEPFFQYTSRWHRVHVSDHHDRNQLVRWCGEQSSPGRFHVCTEDRVPYRKIEHRRGYMHQFRFESREDAILFALIWIGEEAA